VGKTSTGGIAGAATTSPTNPESDAEKIIGVVIQTVPSGAQVLRDGAPVGSTPMVLKLPAGTRSPSLTLRKDGYGEEKPSGQPGADPQLRVPLREVAAPPPPPTLPPPSSETSPRHPSGASGPSAPSGEHKARPKKPKVVAPAHADDIMVPNF